MLPLELKRVTTTYVDTEDRLRLVGETDSGEHHTLWLTQRLVGRLVDRILQWLPQEREEIQEITQQFAQAKHEPEPPVIADPACMSWLVKEITLVPAQGTLGLVFKSMDSGQQTVVVEFNEVCLRQWLNIIFKQHQHAQWVGTDWPAWFEPSSDLPEGVAVH